MLDRTKLETHAAHIPRATDADVAERRGVDFPSFDGPIPHTCGWAARAVACEHARLERIFGDRQDEWSFSKYHAVACVGVSDETSNMSHSG